MRDDRLSPARVHPVDRTVVTAMIDLIDLSPPSLARGNDAIRVTLEDFRASRTPHHAAVVRLWPL